MKIIRDNKDFGEVTFTCNFCDVEFSARRGEYKQEKTNCYEFIEYTKGWFGIKTNTSIYKVIPSFKLSASCPKCNSPSICVTLPSGEPSWTIEKRPVEYP